MNRMEYYGNIEKYKENVIKHQGIKGQKWGVRRWQNPDGTFNAEGKLRYFGTQPKEGIAPAVGLAALWGAEMALLIGIPVTAGAVRDAKTTNKIKKFEQNLETEETDPKTGYKLKNEKMMSNSTKEDMSYVNMEHQYAGMKQKNRDAKEGTDMNCSLCTTAMVLRQKGYDVRAGKRYVGTTGEFQEKIYKGGKFTKGNFKDIMNQLEKEPEGSYGHFSVVWRGGLGGHSMFYKIEKGKPVIYCTQTNEIQNNRILASQASPMDDMTRFMRCDNLEVDFDYVKENKLVR